MNLEMLNAKLQAAMEDCARLNEEGIKIGSKRYTTVATRVEIFRKHFGVFGRIQTEQIRADDEIVQMKAYIGVPLVEKMDGCETTHWVTIAEGDAEEKRNASQINRTSAVENCATSAIGRALAAFGIHGGEFASANEVEQAIHQQSQQAAPAPALSAEQISELHERLNKCTNLEELSKEFLSLGAQEKKACEALKDALKVKFSSEQKSGAKKGKANSPAPSSDKPAESPPEADNNSGAA